ncbi:hypothetical protein KC315_g14647 [Hortaea werneckii]|nr:hypothetical protein KC315_g14647 [Hortaea werneckii]
MTVASHFSCSVIGVESVILLFFITTLSLVSNAAPWRTLPEKKAKSIAEGPLQLVLLQLDSPFHLTENLKALHYSYTIIVWDLVYPSSDAANEIWLYKLGGFLIQKINHVIVTLFANTPAYPVQTCPETRLSEWKFLCAEHDPLRNRSAIAYCCHTLDRAAMILTSSKMFPAGLELGSTAATLLSASIPA